MKRITKLMCLVALLVMVGTSCKKSETKQVFTGTLQDFRVESVDLDDSKTYIEGTTPMFEIGDKVMLFNLNYSNPTASQAALYQATASGHSTSFEPVEEGISNANQGAFFAYYPGDHCYPALSSTENRAYFKLDTIQYYRTIGSSPVMPEHAMFGASRDADAANIGDAEFTFYQVGGVMNLKLYHADGKSVKSIVVEDKYFHLTGFVSMRVDKVNPIVLTGLLENYDINNPASMSEVDSYIHTVGYHAYQANPHVAEAGYFDPKMTVTLDCGAGVPIGTTKATATNFYIGVRPLAFAYGFTITVNYTDGHQAFVDVNKDYRMKAGMIKGFSINLKNKDI